MNAPATTDDSSLRQVRDDRFHDIGSLATQALWLFAVDPPFATSLTVDEQVERLVRDGRLADCNDAFARMYGVDRGAHLVGKTLGDMLVLDDPRNLEFLRSFVRSGYRLDGAETIEKATDGSPRRFLNSLVGMVRDGALTGAWGTQVDLTERIELEQHQRQAETVVALNRLAGGVAHDFNNLLTTILTSVDMLEETLDATHTGRQDAHEIRRAARRGAELTRQLLALSQQQVLVPRPTDLNTIVRRATTAARRSLTSRIDVRTRLAAVPTIANVDGEELEQVLQTMASYAAESMTEGGIFELEVGRQVIHEPITAIPDRVEPGTYVTITITDSAPAHAEHERARLFEPFYGVHLADGGSGLALATLHGFMRQSGGAVVLDAPTTGRRVRLYFPAAAPGAGAGAANDDGSGPSSGTVLLAEDEPTVRLLMKRVLQRAGFVVLVASDGEEALQISRSYSSRIDVLVSDVIMPRMGGGELSRRLRQERPEIKVLHVSGYTAGALRQHEALDDSAAFLQKPFTPKALISRLREVLAG